MISLYDLYLKIYYYFFPPVGYLRLWRPRNPIIDKDRMNDDMCKRRRMRRIEFLIDQEMDKES